ncbi:NlpC/P60 family protein [Gordonia humi]|uniref:Cell wall-associated NlpC family hydrolase n=2 Tax=Gordonia humi TaxID=686429 RepID=A0A840FDC9_9ACTN|nr:NlpC/P60 family protein [Gordonia humi]MBB4137477.1 cell wall-associated NlpC family hydrolase [Gordonia humi]
MSAGLLTAGPAVAEPTKSNPIASLINRIADVDQTLTDLSDAVAAKQEHVNKALVDFQNAMAARQLAVSANAGAKKSLTAVGAEVERAQREFDDFVRTVFRQGDNRGAMTEYVASDDPSTVLEKLSAVDRVTAQQQRAVRRLQVARNRQANRVAATEVAQRQASATATDAADRRDDAVSAYQAAQEAMRTQQSRRTDLVKQRDDLAVRLAKLRGRPAPTARAQPKPGAPRLPDAVTDGLGDAVDAIPTRPVDGDDALAQAAEAAAKLAADSGQALLASLIGQQQIPHSQLLDELGIGGANPFEQGDDSVFTRIGNGSLGSLFGGDGDAIRPGLRGPQAIEVVVNRMKSQLGVPYAWGGGDANGPTLGVRDGGVADSYGDFQKVGFDCSGLMQYGFAGVGLDIPKYSGYQYTAGPQIPLAERKRGDMIFWGPGGSQHVAMTLGDGTMIEAKESGTVVHIVPERTDGAQPMVVRML